MEIDRLSALPDTLLIDILGRLYNTKAAVRTAVLSKQWRFLWTNLSSISLSHNYSYLHEVDEIEIDRFVAGVHAVAARTKPPLQKLTVYFRYDKRFASDVDTWLDFAAMSEVKHLHLDLRQIHYPRVSSSRYTLPQVIFYHSQLMTLQLSDCNVAPPAAAVEWRSMTGLTIRNAELTQQAIDEIASGCPALRRLELICCSGFHRLDIRGCSFCYLKVERKELSYGEEEEEQLLLEISAPYMRDLDLDLDPNRMNVRLDDASSLEKASIKFFSSGLKPSRFSNEEIIGNINKLFEEIRRVRSLKLCFDFSEVLAMMINMDWRFPQSLVEELEINGSPNEENAYVVLAILESSPFLEKLIITSDILIQESLEWKVYEDNDLNHDLSHLKNVRFEICYADPEFCGELSFTLAQILLKRAPILEEMVIQIPRRADELIKKFETLLTYPLSSQKAVIEIDYLSDLYCYD